MDWMTRLIDVRDIFTECQNCEHRQVKQISDFCRNCVYKILSDKIECEKRAYLEREKKNGKSE